MEHGETRLHLCVKHDNLEAPKLLVETVGDHEGPFDSAFKMLI